MTNKGWCSGIFLTHCQNFNKKSMSTRSLNYGRIFREDWQETDIRIRAGGLAESPLIFNDLAVGGIHTLIV